MHSFRAEVQTTCYWHCLQLCVLFCLLFLLKGGSKMLVTHNVNGVIEMSFSFCFVSCCIVCVWAGILCYLSLSGRWLRQHTWPCQTEWTPHCRITGRCFLCSTCNNIYIFKIFSYKNSIGSPVSNVNFPVAVIVSYFQVLYHHFVFSVVVLVSALSYL